MTYKIEAINGQMYRQYRLAINDEPQGYFSELEEAKTHLVELLLEQLEKIDKLSTGWKAGEEGLHLLRINDLAVGKNLL